MNPNDINTLINKMVNRKRTRQQTNAKDNTNDYIKRTSLEEYLTVFEENKFSHNNARDYLDNVEKILHNFNSDKKIAKQLRSYININMKIINDIRKVLDKKGNSSSTISFLKKEIKNCYKEKDITDDDDDMDEDDDEDYDDDDDDSDSDSDDEDDYIRHRSKRHKTDMDHKLGKEFIEQLYRNKHPGQQEDETIKYFSSLPKKEKSKTLTKITEINNYTNTDVPIVFQIMNLELPLEQKNLILKNHMSVVTARSDNNKLKQWVDSVLTIPFGQFKGISLDSIKPENVKSFLNNIQTSMDNAVYGHDEAKRMIVQMMGQQIKNPKAKGNMLGLYGCPGNGKTSLLKEGVAKAMDKPFIFISLGGATDASFLEGHSFTYEGSIYGRIVNGLINAKCMDPIIYFDELDKISNTPKGEEITNILVHLTDPVQNNSFRDKYFHGIDIDLSRATMIFSFNDRSRINPVLADRITMVETKFLLPTQKIHIFKNYLCPVIYKEMGFIDNAINFSDEIISNLISLYTNEGGVRKLKGLLYSICRELNIANLTKTKLNGVYVKFPFTLENKHLKTLLQHKMEITKELIHTEPKCCIINGLYASGDGGHGGILPIEILWIPTSKPFEIKATGNLEKVIMESTDVASTLAFNYLDKEKQDSMLTEMKERPKGFHIHLGDGSVSKDGPSAGTALTVALVSMLTNRKIKNDIAITGEITLQGKVTAIGGLENKLQGAKSAGVTLVLYPKENQKHIDKIKERNPTLIDGSLSVIAIETLDEAIKYSLI